MVSGGDSMFLLVLFGTCLLLVELLVRFIPLPFPVPLEFPFSLLDGVGLESISSWMSIGTKVETCSETVITSLKCSDRCTCTRTDIYTCTLNVIHTHMYTQSTLPWMTF